ncbi:hypothetical protein [Actinomadura rugatobispora]|uniref:WD40 repeat domain-containing protein n=1 Tax=Actinomadura rugatobispora TaxID=1994 RepID=A0ABW1AAK2_9ACTN|nr:hypothetical protein GCM10010200_032450 [Actinomadura rugatobispora]
MDGKHKDPAPGGGLGAAWRGIVPIGVASFVALAIGGGVDIVHRHQKSGEKERSAQPAAERDETGPRHVVAIRGAGGALVVRDVRSGRDVGLPVAAPRAQRFQRVAAAGDGSFVVAAAASGQVTFQRLRLNEDGGPEELAALPKAAVTGASTAWSDMAVAPDGDRIAYVTYQSGGIGRLEVVSAQTGQRKAWTTKTPARVSSLSWAGATLSFVWSPTRKVGGRIVHQVRTLDTAAAPGDLKTSKPVLKLPEGSSGAAVLGRDGRTIVAGLAQNAQITLQAFAIDTGRPGGVLWRQKGAGQVTRVSADHAGEHLLVLASDGRLHMDGAQPMPADDLVDAAW